ncbi:hypothetical protein [Reichenbachiella versicolor]|uniref:hypothetical protein n=1 Tax=Reichenbachiella versicolor TaxID=1821036 RepID=UPI000D6E65BB|nr:hypothetical protein [Reichenbachiella versicolor]
MNQIQRKCPECERPVFGRADKKFCSDSCRNAYNNKESAQITNKMRNVNNSLRKNWKVLSTLNKTGKTKIQRQKLLENGFDFKLITSVYQTKAGHTYRYCYDQGYLELEGDYILLVQNQDF